MSSVDLPMPGSPPTSVTDPGTMPPPSTKSNSASPVFQRATVAACISESRTGAAPDPARDGPSARRPIRPTASSTNVFHAPHASHLPAHFGCSAPPSVQRNTERPLDTGELWRQFSLAGVIESREPLFEDPRDGASRSVALLPDNQLGLSLDVVAVLVQFLPVRRRRHVHLFTIDEQHHVGVLLDGPRLTEVRQLRAAMLAPPLLRRARKLGEGEYGDVQLFGQCLQRPRDVRDLLLPVVQILRALHELEVIDDHQIDVVLGFESPSFGPYRQWSQRRAIIDPDVCGTQKAGGACELGIVGVLQHTTSQLLRVHQAF